MLKTRQALDRIFVISVDDGGEFIRDDGARPRWTLQRNVRVRTAEVKFVISAIVFVFNFNLKLNRPFWAIERG